MRSESRDSNRKEPQVIHITENERYSSVTAEAAPVVPFNFWCSSVSFPVKDVVFPSLIRHNTDASRGDRYEKFLIVSAIFVRVIP